MSFTHEALSTVCSIEEGWVRVYGTGSDWLTIPLVGFAVSQSGMLKESPPISEQQLPPL